MKQIKLETCCFHLEKGKEHPEVLPLLLVHGQDSSPPRVQNCLLQELVPFYLVGGSNGEIANMRSISEEKACCGAWAGDGE